MVADGASVSQTLVIFRERSLIESERVRHYMKMRVLLGLLSAVALACAIGACAAIAGLNRFSS